ncbi:putative conjugative transposon protein [Clostridioides difficile CD9]|nr:putative conjugative transposon protein [Clostridioides difficile CD9]
MFCCGSLNRTAAVFFAQRQRRDEPCGYGDDCRHAPLLPACHV